MVETAERERMWRHAAAAAAVLALHALLVLPLLYHAALPPPASPALVAINLIPSEKAVAPAPKPVEIPEPALEQPVISAPVMPHLNLPSLVPPASIPVPASAPALAPAQPVAATSSGMPTSSRAAKEDYAAKLRAWLAAHKRDPLQARRMRLEGAALLQLRVGPQGQVVTYRIEQSTGSAILDREVEAMLARSVPLPIPPADIVGGGLEFRFRIRFDLSALD